MTEIIPLKEIRPFSYTRAANDEQCRRMRYLSREWGGTGLQPVSQGWALVFGNIVHKALEDFAKTGHVDLKSVRENVKEQARVSGFDDISQRDWAGLVEGLVLGFQRAVWPNLMAEYDIIGTERWIEWVVDGYRFRARQDLLLQSKFDKHICLVDYKTTSSTQPQWIKSWNKSVQLHSSMYAMRMSEGIDVERAIVIGLSKGYADKKKNLQRSPLNYGYVNREYAMSPAYSYEYTRARGWEQFSTTDEFDDLSSWIANMPVPLLTEQFPQTGPIFCRDDIAKKWFRQQLIREAEVDTAAQLLQTSTSVEEIETVLDKYFRQNFSHCDPAFGFSCAFQNLCWVPHVELDPLGSGQFIRYAEHFDE